MYASSSRKYLVAFRFDLYSQVVYSLLMPSIDPMADDAFEFQVSFL